LVVKGYTQLEGID